MKDKSRVKHNTCLEEGVDFDGGLGDTRECPLGTLASTAEASEGTGIL